MNRLYYSTLLLIAAIACAFGGPGTKPEVIDMKKLPHADPNKRSSEVHMRKEVHPVSEEAFEAMKKAANSSNAPTGGSTFANNVAAPPNGGTSFAGPGQNGWVPYDAAIAVGPNHVVVMTNSQIGTYTKAGAFISLVQFDDFFGKVGTGGFDPKCYYDAAGGHFVLLCSQEGKPVARMDVAVSQTSDATGLWWMYHLDWTLDNSTPTSNWGDYPSLGYSDNAIFISANQYSFSSSYKYSKVRVLSKAQMFSGATATWTDFINLTDANGISSQTVKAGRMISSSTSEYLMNTVWNGGNYVTLWRIDNAPQAPTLTRVATVSVAQYALAPNARQPGGHGLDAMDSRMQDVVMQNGTVYGTWSESYRSGNDKGDAIRYLAVSTAGVKKQDISYFQPGMDRYYGAVSFDASGNMLMVFSQSSNTEYASVYRTGMRTTDGGIGSAALIHSGSSNIAFGRWGDYAAVANDPSNSGAIWMYNGYAAAGGKWGSWISSASFGTAPKTSPTPVADAAPASFHLDANYPNPFNPTTMISFGVERNEHASLVVYNIIGEVVGRLFDGQAVAGQSYQLEFDASGLASGMYYYQLTTDSRSESRKMMLLR